MQSENRMGWAPEGSPPARKGDSLRVTGQGRSHSELGGNEPQLESLPQ